MSGSIRTPPPSQWGSWDDLPDPVEVNNPTEEQKDMLVRTNALRDLHDGYFRCPSPEVRQWLLRRSHESVSILQARIKRVGR
jgi:hypothetical protein